MKKKSLALFMCTLAVVGVIGCGKKEEPAPEPEVVEEVTEVTDVVEGPLTENFERATDVLDLVNQAFDDETRNYFGSIAEDGEMTQGVACELSLDDADVVRNMVTFPAGLIDSVDEAAVLSHMMNANTYTSAAFHLVNPEDAVTVAGTIMDTVTNNQWLCGFPQKLVIGQVENYIVYAYGNEELMQTFEQGLINSDSTATIHFIQDLTVTEELPDELLAPTTEIIMVDEFGNPIESATEDVEVTEGVTEENTEVAGASDTSALQAIEENNEEVTDVPAE